MKTHVEWSHVIEADEIGQDPMSMTITPDEHQKMALKDRLGVTDILRLDAKINITREQGGYIVRISGTIHADVFQDCVITLEPVKKKVREEFESFFADRTQAVTFVAASKRLKYKNNDDELPIMDEKDDPEPIENGSIDLGELITQHLSLALDPYPHGEGVFYENGDEGESLRQPSELRKNPFAALQYWQTDTDQEPSE